MELNGSVKEAGKIVNQQLVDYIRQNSSNYRIDELKNFLIQKGYSKKDVEEAARIASGPIPPMMPMNDPQLNPQSNSSGDTTKACIAYLLTWLTGLIIYFTADKNDRYTRFHAMQAIFLGIAITVIYIVLSILLVPLFFVGSIIGGLFIMPLLWLASLALIIIMMVNAYKGNKTKLPIIGNLAENIVEKS